MIIEFEVPGLPETTNQILAMKLRTRLGRKHYWKDLVWKVSASQRPPQPFKRAILTLTRCSTTRPDPDGMVSSFKHVIDALVISRILEDDSFEHIGMPTYLFQKVERGKGKIRIRVEEVT